jgi:hypothetical protein
MPDLSNLGRIRRFAARSIAITLTVLLPSCAQISSLLSDDADPAMNADMASKKVREAKAADKQAQANEARELKKERQEEKTEDRNFAATKQELEQDLSKAGSNPDQASGVSRLFFDKEMLAVNERIHSLSARVEALSERIHELTGQVENVPEELAKLKLELAKTAEQGQNAAPKRSTPTGKHPGAPFWGIQLGAYKTRPGAEEAWAAFLANPMAVELNDAKVQYVLTKPLKNGRRLTLIIVNQYASQSAADGACNTLKGNGIDCVAFHVKQ